ncbi:MAG: hypothetical protein ACOYEA_00775 [Fermentimonas sp.]|jgi:hypothetical protein
MNKIASFISTVFQPLLMPTYSVMLLFTYTYFGTYHMNRFWNIVLPVFLFSFAIPAILIYIIYKLKIISDLSLKVRRERFIPYTIALLSYTFLLVYYIKMNMPKWFVMMVAASIAIMVIAIIITLFWKISAHMFGAGGLVGGAMAISFFVQKSNPYLMFMGLFLLAGMVGTSRLILKRHTLAQVNAGFLLGFLMSFVFVWIGA